MHADEVDTDADLVGRLLAGQFPHWAGRGIEPVASTGTDNALYRLGDDMVVRLPRIHWAVDAVAKEQRWLPTLAPALPVAIPTPLGSGRPAEGYPYPWSVYRWLEGQNPVADELDDATSLAGEVARFVVALRHIDPSGAPAAERGGPLVDRDAPTRKAIVALKGMIDTTTADAAWTDALRVPAWSGPSVWIHGDLQSGNLLTVDGRLGAVIDFGGLGVGDPACDLIVAWNLFSGRARQHFRDAVGADEQTWARGRGWALSIALIALPYYLETNPAIVAGALRTIHQVLADHRAAR